MGTLGLSTHYAPKVPCWWSGLERTCDPFQAEFSASLINPVSDPARLDWSRSCIPLTRGLKIPWGILIGSLWVSGDSTGKEPLCWSGLEGEITSLKLTCKLNQY